MAKLRAFLLLPVILCFMAAVDAILFALPIPGWIPVALIVLQALYVTVVYGFLLMGCILPRPSEEPPS